MSQSSNPAAKFQEAQRTHLWGSHSESSEGGDAGTAGVGKAIPFPLELTLPRMPLQDPHFKKL